MGWWEPQNGPEKSRVSWNPQLVSTTVAGGVGHPHRRPPNVRDPTSPCPSRRYFNCSSPGVQACGVPASCCRDPLENGSVPNVQCGFGVLGLGAAAAGALLHPGGCGAALGAWLRGQAGAIAAGAAALVLVEAVGALLALRVLGDIAAVRGWE